MITIEYIGQLRDLVAERVDLATRNGKTSVNLNDLDVSRLTSLDSALSGIDFPIDVSHWDVSNIESAFEAFLGCKLVGTLENWNVSKIKNMRLMFCACSFDVPQDFSKWDVSGCENFQAMFNDAKGNLFGFENWQMSSAKSIKYMFLGEERSFFNKINIASWVLNDNCERKEFVEEISDCNIKPYRREVDFDEFQMLCQKRTLDKLNDLKLIAKNRFL